MSSQARQRILLCLGMSATDEDALKYNANNIYNITFLTRSRIHVYLFNIEKSKKIRHVHVIKLSKRKGKIKNCTKIYI